jgi:ABC-type multidrug transport system fused ATPase/permease subunit
MKTMGLYDSAFWFSWFVTLLTFSSASVFILITSGCLFQFDFFLQNDFGLYFVLLYLFALSMVAMTFLISTFVKKADSATSVGFLVFILGFFIQLGSTYVFSTIAPRGLRILFSLFSPSLLQVGLSALATATTPGNRPLTWADRDSQSVLGAESTISFNQIYGWLFLDFLLYLVIALYLDNVLPTAYGTRRPFYYFLTPSYWTGKSRPVTKNGKDKHNHDEKEKVDEDVLVEEETVAKGTYPKNTAVKIDQLRKVYSGDESCCSCSSKGYVAVKGLSLYMESDTLLCLLGHNGAGKVCY